MTNAGPVTTWPLSLWYVLLTLVPFFILYVIVTVIVFARVHPHKRVRLRLRRLALSNAREGLEWKIPGLVIGITWYLLITNIPVRFLSWFGIHVVVMWVGFSPLTSQQVITLPPTSLLELVMYGVLVIAMIIFGAFLSAWIHNLRVPAETAE